MIRTKGEAGSGNIVEAVRHMPGDGGIAGSSCPRRRLMTEAKNLGAPYELVRGSPQRKLPVPIFPRAASPRRPTPR